MVALRLPLTGFSFTISRQHSAHTAQRRPVWTGGQHAEYHLRCSFHDLGKKKTPKKHKALLPSLQMQEPSTAEQVAWLWQEQVDVQPGPYRPGGHTVVQSSPWRRKRHTVMEQEEAARGLCWLWPKPKRQWPYVFGADSRRCRFYLRVTRLTGFYVELLQTRQNKVSPAVLVIVTADEEDGGSLSFRGGRLFFHRGRLRSRKYYRGPPRLKVWNLLW